jgi:hypothetical protein
MPQQSPMEIVSLLFAVVDQVTPTLAEHLAAVVDVDSNSSAMLHFYHDSTGENDHSETFSLLGHSCLHQWNSDR